MGETTTTECLPQACNSALLSKEYKDFFTCKFVQLNETFDTAAGPDDSLQPDFPLGKLSHS